MRAGKSRASCMKEHIRRCVNKYIFTQAHSLDHKGVTRNIIFCSLRDEVYNQVLLQLISHDNWADSLDEVLSEDFVYLWIGGVGVVEEMWKNWLRQDPFRRFLGKNPPSCFLEKAIMIGSFFVHYPTDNEELRTQFKKLLVLNLTTLLQRKHCPRGTSDKFPRLDSKPPTSIARELGVLEFWREALVRTGHDASDIIDEDLYGGFIELFDGLPYLFSERGGEGEGEEEEEEQKPSLVSKAARTALIFVSSIV